MGRRQYECCEERSVRRRNTELRDVEQSTGDARADDQASATLALQAAGAINLPILSHNAVVLNLINILNFGSTTVAVAGDSRAVATNAVRPTNEVESGSNFAR